MTRAQDDSRVAALLEPQDVGAKGAVGGRDEAQAVVVLEPGGNPFRSEDFRELKLREPESRPHALTLSPEQVRGVVQASGQILAAGHAALVGLVAGSGLRIGEAFHLAMQRPGLRRHSNVRRRQLELDGLDALFDVETHTEELAPTDSERAPIFDDRRDDLAAAEGERHLRADSWRPSLLAAFGHGFNVSPR